MNKPIALVTGAPGWVGTRLTRVIAEGLHDADRFNEGAPDRLIRCLVLPNQDTTSFV